MAFTLVLSDASSPSQYSDDAHYRFNNHGMLVIEPGNGHELIYSPTAWRYLDDPDPQARMHFRARQPTSSD
jgi:hypothetical protein